MSSVNKIKDKVYRKCNGCDKLFKCKSILKRHERTHSNVKSFFCLCGKSFSQKCSVKSHVRRFNKKGEYFEHCMLEEIKYQDSISVEGTEEMEGTEGTEGMEEDKIFFDIIDAFIENENVLYMTL